MSISRFGDNFIRVPQSWVMTQQGQPVIWSRLHNFPSVRLHLVGKNTASPIFFSPQYPAQYGAFIMSLSMASSTMHLSNLDLN